MAIFEPVTLTWSGKDYVIPADGVLRCIAQVEDVITLGTLHTFISKGNLPLAKIAGAFGVALRAAGCRVTDDEVYSGMFTAKGAELQRRAFEAVAVLQQLMIPPEHLRADETKTPAAGGRAASSRKSTSSRSGSRG